MPVITEKKINDFFNTMYSSSVSWRGNYPLPNRKLWVFLLTGFCFRGKKKSANCLSHFLSLSVRSEDKDKVIL